jgi:hypothetical protein
MGLNLKARRKEKDGIKGKKKRERKSWTRARHGYSHLVNDKNENELNELS